MERAKVAIQEKIRTDGFGKTSARQLTSKVGSRLMDAHPKDAGPFIDGKVIPFYATKTKLYGINRRGTVKEINVDPPLTHKEAAKSVAVGAAAGAIIGTVVLIGTHGEMRGKMVHLGTVAVDKSGEIVSDIGKVVRKATRGKKSRINEEGIEMTPTKKK